MEPGEPRDFSVEEFVDAHAPTIDDLSIQSRVDKLAQHQTARVEEAVKSAIQEGYNGVDVKYSTEIGKLGMESIERWYDTPSNPEPGFHVERYTWKWFDEERLREAIENDEIMKLVE